ncbi:HNH endonuclease signature motif containing protein [Corynebacterium pseudotuberculosis]|uniref:HNH endonuclease signature motif containing protein n=1 Tax=Corynebacterium pseudotuberculosis TaxID=1719 RepID=UPI00031F79DA|nr:HNH endonuclease signature motif containing protein [Corynebacterium pseudotuberculosis]AFM07853.2 HNH endonuclease [Corynebacterium pseudotuberculosis Cp162]APG82239.1 Endonuclease [Corynebacterium pseudotuberculosis]WFP66670.1 HNH endonuclease [Corynebacterium pseudotuberculosis]
MNVKECLEFLAANGVALAEYIFSVSQTPRAKVELSALFGIEPTTMGRYIKTAKALFGPTKDNAMREEALAIARQGNLGIDTIALINTKVSRLRDHNNQEAFRVELLLFACKHPFTVLKQHADVRLQEENNPSPSHSQGLRYARFSHAADANNMRYLFLSLPEELMTAIEARMVDYAHRFKNKNVSAQQALADAITGTLLHDDSRSPNGNVLREGLILLPADGWKNNGGNELVTTDGATIKAADLADHLLADFGYAVLYDENAEPVNLFRTRRLANAKQRIILTADQLLCADPSCSRAAFRAQCHHIDAWKHGGTTNLENLAMVCGSHNAQNDDDHILGKHRNGHYAKCPTTGRVGWQPPDPEAPLQFNEHPLSNKSARMWALRHFSRGETTPNSP